MAKHSRRSPRPRPPRGPAPRSAPRRRADTTPEALRARLEAERQAAIEQLRRLRGSPDLDDSETRGTSDAIQEEGDAAQASERRDMEFTQRARLADRIDRLTQALERIAYGVYGRCEMCGGDIEPSRLAALPEARTCLGCQKRLEASGTPEAAA